MKMNLFTKHCAAALFFAATITFQSCNDHDFDWEEAHRQNAEYNYEQNFAQIFGAIDPNQDWDFSSGTRIFGTRGNATSTENAISQADLNKQWSSGENGWYYVEPATIKYLQDNLIEGDENLSKGHSFTCQVPEGGFTITPIYQGGNANTNVTFHMIVTDEKGSVDYLIWSKNEHLEKTGEKLCPTCDGDGKVGWGWDAKDCPDCHGTGTAAGWFNVGVNVTSGKDPGYDGNTLGRPWTVATKGIRGQTLTINKGDLPAGATLTFYTTATTSGGTNLVHYSTPPTGKNAEILALTDMATPENMKGEDHKTDGIQNEVMIISCEAGSDTDLNDLAFIFEGKPYKPQPIDIKNETQDVTTHIYKRYMVEDMGYSDPGSPAALNNYTDIDFNDIVIDFDQATTQTYKITTTTIAGVPTVKREKQGNPTIASTATIRALGGTWDFVLYVGEKPVFQKSQAATYLDFNDNYKIGGVMVKNAGIVYGRMYNTARKSDMRGDGNYNLTGDASWIGKIKNTNNYLNAWDPTTNNISFVIVENDTDISDWHMEDYFDSKTDNGNVYRLSFPAMGACPKIVAFDVTKPWQKEKVHVNTDWFKSDTGTVDQKLDQNIK